jgi:hypothetical protein
MKENTIITFDAHNAHHLLIHIEPLPGTWTEACGAVVGGLGTDAIACDATAWEITGSHLDADEARTFLTRSFGGHARVHCIDLDLVNTPAAYARVLGL